MPQRHPAETPPRLPPQCLAAEGVREELRCVHIKFAPHDPFYPESAHPRGSPSSARASGSVAALCGRGGSKCNSTYWNLF